MRAHPVILRRRASNPTRRALNFEPGTTDKPGVDQVSRPMQIALVAVVLLAGMWFTVLKPKSETAPPTAPGAAGLDRSVDAAQGAAAASDAANAAVQQTTGGTTSTATAATTKATATKTTMSAKAAATKPALAKNATPTDPSNALLGHLAKGKTVVLLFHGKGADDRAARKAVRRAARQEAKVIAAYAPISKVAAYRAITTDVQVTTAPTILVISRKKQAVALTGFVDVSVVRQAIGDVRVAAGQKR